MANSQNSKLLYSLDDYERDTGKCWEDGFYHPSLIRQGTGQVEATATISNRRSISKREKAIIWAKTQGYCYHCNCVLNPFAGFHIDHLIPLSKGGEDTVENCVPSCAHCNLKKGNGIC